MMSSIRRSTRISKGAEAAAQHQQDHQDLGTVEGVQQYEAAREAANPVRALAIDNHHIATANLNEGALEGLGGLGAQLQKMRNSTLKQVMIDLYNQGMAGLAQKEVDRKELEQRLLLGTQGANLGARVANAEDLAARGAEAQGLSGPQAQVLAGQKAMEVHQRQMVAEKERLEGLMEAYKSREATRETQLREQDARILAVQKEAAANKSEAARTRAQHTESQEELTKVNAELAAVRARNQQPLVPAPQQGMQQPAVVGGKGTGFLSARANPFSNVTQETRDAWKETAKTTKRRGKEWDHYKQTGEFPSELGKTAECEAITKKFDAAMRELKETDDDCEHLRSKLVDKEADLASVVAFLGERGLLEEFGKHNKKRRDEKKAQKAAKRQKTQGEASMALMPVQQ